MSKTGTCPICKTNAVVLSGKDGECDDCTSKIIQRGNKPSKGRKG